MGLTARDKKGGEDFVLLDEGMFHAICYAIYDLGHQYNETYGKTTHKCRIIWELPKERIQIEKDGDKKDLPRSISKEYTISLHKKSLLRQHLQSWRGKSFTDKELDGFDITRLLKVNCYLQVLHHKKEDKIYAYVSGIVPLPPDIKKLEPENEPRYFSFEEHGDKLPKDTPEWIIDLIKASNEWEDLHRGNSNAEMPYGDTPPPDDDDLPF